MKQPKNFITDMDGVLVTGRRMIPGADRFIGTLQGRNIPYLVLTNNPKYTPRDLSHRLATAGLDIPEQNIFTSALATAYFLDSQRPDGTAFVIGDSGLTDAIHKVGYVITDTDPDYVVLGESSTINYEVLTKAIRLIDGGARFVATNPDVSGPDESGLVPACGAIAALIESATGKSPFFVGKPNPLMMRTALNFLGVHSEDTMMIGDRMDTDIIAGVESGMMTTLVLSGVTDLENIDKFPYRPGQVLQSIADLEL